MLQYERLAEEHRQSRRTLADALEVLRARAGFTERDRAAIRIGRFQLQSRHIVGLVQIFFENLFDEKVYIVSLPTSVEFHAMRLGAARRERFDIALLDGSAIDGNGNVLVTDGPTLRAVEVVPARLLLEPSKLDWLIIYYTITLAGAQDKCLWSLRDSVPDQFRHTVPELRFLDCGKLSGLTLPPLKIIAAYLAERDWTLKQLSTQKIADALRKFGIRVPTPRPRLSRGQASAEFDLDRDSVSRL